jgi:hypothetical protein
MRTVYNASGDPVTLVRVTAISKKGFVFGRPRPNASDGWYFDKPGGWGTSTRRGSVDINQPYFLRETKSQKSDTHAVAVVSAVEMSV